MVRIGSLLVARPEFYARDGNRKVPGIHHDFDMELETAIETQPAFMIFLYMMAGQVMVSLCHEYCVPDPVGAQKVKIDAIACFVVFHST